MDKYQNKYRIPSARLQSWDYASEAAYFVTICTHDRQCFFGDVLDGVMVLNELGQLAEKYWLKISTQFPFIALGNFVVMPNHIHGILIIDKQDVDVETRFIASQFIASENGFIPSLQPSSVNGGITGHKNPMFHENIARIIRWYKGRCSFDLRKIHADFAWQSRFYDHIIRDTRSYDAISAYIINNPVKWNDDVFNPLNNETNV